MKDPITVAAFPQVASLLANKEFDTFKLLLCSVYRILWIPAAAVLLAAVICDDAILGVWSDEFEDSGNVMFWTMSRTMVPLLGFWTVPLFLSLGLVRLRLVTVIVSSIVGFGLAFCLAERWQAEGVAFAMAVGALTNELILAVVGMCKLRPSATMSIDSRLKDMDIG